MDDFFTDTTILFEQCELHFNADNPILVQSLSARAEECMSVMRTLYARVENSILTRVCPPNGVEGIVLVNIAFVRQVTFSNYKIHVHVHACIHVQLCTSPWPSHQPGHISEAIQPLGRGLHQAGLACSCTGCWWGHTL